MEKEKGIFSSVVAEERGKRVWGEHECGLMRYEGVKIWLHAFLGV